MEWITKYWKTFAAIVYFSICILDFLIIPSFMMYQNTYENKIKYFQKIQMIWDDDPKISEYLTHYGAGEWIPFSLRGGGILHISFGAILTGSILGKKKE